MLTVYKLLNTFLLKPKKISSDTKVIYKIQQNSLYKVIPFVISSQEFFGFFFINVPLAAPKTLNNLNF